MCTCNCKPTDEQLKAAERKGWTDAAEYVRKDGFQTITSLLAERDRRFPRKLRVVSIWGQQWRLRDGKLETRTDPKGDWYAPFMGLDFIVWSHPSKTTPTRRSDGQV